MAVTIHQTPEAFTPSDNPVVWTFSSDQTAQSNFYYQISIYIDDALVAEEQIFPESGIYAKYDASDWASNSCNRPTTSTAMEADAANTCEVRITITERYGTPVADQASTAGTNIVCWKAGMFNEDFAAWDSSAYVVDGVTTDLKWLTNFPTEYYQKVGLTEHVRLMLLTDETDVDLTITLYDEDDNSIASASSTYGAANFVSIFNFAPDVIVDDTAITDANFSTCSYYIISEDSGEVEDYRFEIQTDCQYDSYKRLHFLSTWGSIESLSYNLVSRVSNNPKSYGYRRYWGEWNSSAFEFNDSQGTDLDFAKIVTRSMRIESDWLFEEIQHWIVDNLHTSNLVMIEDTAGVLLERSIKARRSEKKWNKEDQLFTDKVTVVMPSLINARL